jgi:pimeloyl-ACP methyl ester carboxylesterase
MPAVLVHGVPSTAAMWEPLRPHLRRADVVTLSLPGFGVPVPEGFACTKEAYAGWLIEAIERLPAPIDLVGHDWGAILVLRAASLRPALIRSWAAVDATIDRDYTWHRLAQAWQTPGRGEEIMERMVPERVAATGIAEGMPETIAREEAARVDATMKAAILRLYRSAVDVGAEWDRDVGLIRAPGLVAWGEDDPYVGVEFGERLVRRTGARWLRLPATGHWLPHQQPEALARALQQLWASA